MTSWLRSSEKTLEAVHLPLGHADYATTYRLQRRLPSLRSHGEIVDTVLTVEHNPVFTIGRSGSALNVLAPPEILQQEGILIYKVERGGNITYHGPGQLVIYPIIDLRDQGHDLHRYVRNLEQTVINFLSEVGVTGRRHPGFPGVWVNSYKIASVGVYVKHWVTRHGLALNVAVDKAHFGMINPCGMEIEVVSLNELIEQPLPLEEVATGLITKMEPLFGWRFTRANLHKFWEG